MRFRNPDFGALDPESDSDLWVPNGTSELRYHMHYAYKSWIIEFGGQLVLQIVYAGDVRYLTYFKHAKVRSLQFPQFRTHSIVSHIGMNNCKPERLPYNFEKITKP